MIKEIHIEGLEHLNDTLSELAPREAINILKQTLVAEAKGIRDDMRANAPASTRKLKKNIRHKRQRGSRTLAEAAVYVKKDASTGAWYWHFVEFGTRLATGVAQPFIVPAYERARPKFRKMFETTFMNRLQRHLAKKAKK